MQVYHPPLFCSKESASAWEDQADSRRTVKGEPRIDTNGHQCSSCCSGGLRPPILKRFLSVRSVNGAEGISNIEGKVARVSGERVGRRSSFKSVVATPVPSENSCRFVVTASSAPSETKELIRRLQPTAIYLREILLSAAQTVSDRRATRS